MKTAAQRVLEREIEIAREDVERLEHQQKERKERVKLNDARIADARRDLKHYETALRTLGGIVP